MKLNSLLSIIFIVVFSLSCNHARPKPFSNNEAMKSDIPITRITLHPGDVYFINLPELATAGYNWYYEVDKDWIISVLEQLDATEPAHEIQGKKGGENLIRFKISGLKEGKVFLHFFQKRGWGKQANPIKEQLYQVDVIDQKP